MALTSRFPGEIIIADNPENVVFGTCMLGDTYGSVESASVKRGADVEEIKKCGGALLAVVTHNAHFELTMECLYSADVEPPGIGELIVFPLAGVSGRVMPGAEIKWEMAGQRMLSFTAKSWDAFSDNQGAGNVVEVANGIISQPELDDLPGWQDPKIWNDAESWNDAA